MFMFQMIEDISFEDVVTHFNEDEYFVGFANKYQMSSEDKDNFEVMKKQDEGYRTSLRVLTVVQDGMIPRVLLMDEDDNVVGLGDWSYVELGRMPVDSYYSGDLRRSIRLLLLLLLEKTYFKRLVKEGS